MKASSNLTAFPIKAIDTDQIHFNTAGTISEEKWKNPCGGDNLDSRNILAMRRRTLSNSKPIRTGPYQEAAPS